MNRTANSRSTLALTQQWGRRAQNSVSLSGDAHTPFQSSSWVCNRQSVMANCAGSHPGGPVLTNSLSHSVAHHCCTLCWFRQVAAQAVPVLGHRTAEGVAYVGENKIVLPHFCDLHKDRVAMDSRLYPTEFQMCGWPGSVCAGGRQVGLSVQLAWLQALPCKAQSGHRLP